MNRTIALASSSVLTSAAIFFVLAIRSRDQYARDISRTVYELSFPTDLAFDAIVATVRGLTGLRAGRWWLLGRDSVVFELIQRDTGIEYRLRLPRHQVDRVLGHLRSLTPGVQAMPVEDAKLPAATVVQELALTTNVRSIRTDEPAAFVTSLVAWAAVLAPASDEAVIFQVVAAPWSLHYHLPAEDSLGAGPEPRWLRSLVGRAAGGVVPSHDTKLRQAKLAEPMFAVALRIGAASPSRGRSRHLVSLATGSLHQLDQPGVSFVRHVVPAWWSRDRLAQGATPITLAPVHLNARELAVLVAWPAGDIQAAGLRRRSGKLFPPASELPERGRVIGQAIYPGQERPVAITPTDALMHMLVSGPTGSGKSTFLLGLIKQDIEAGRGLVLIDPNGDLARDAIDIITADRINDLIFIDPSDSAAVALDPLAGAAHEAERVADQILDLVRDRSQSWGVQLEETLRNTLVLLAVSPGMGLTEVPTVLLNEGFRRYLLSNLDPLFGSTVGEFFARFDSWSTGQKAEAAAAVLNKTSRWLDRRPVRAMLGQTEPNWSLRQVLDEAKILIVSLPAGVVGPEAADLIGGLVVTQAWNAAQARATVRGHRRPATFLYIDELPRFLRSGSNLSDILARARGYGLGLVGALQHTGQASPALRSALLSEARNKVIFQPAAEDAALFARHLPGVTVDDLLGLSPHTALVSLVQGGRVTEPVSVAIVPAPKPTGHGQAAQAASRQCHGRDWTAVEHAIQERRRRGQTGPRRVRRLP
jgi:DNA helicase HerA-like ATPase